MVETIIPCNTNVLLKFYEKNPYTEITRTESGIYMGVESKHIHKSNETGELEFDQELVGCAQVIAVGPKCTNVQVGDDVYCWRSNVVPIPYRRKGYYTLNEQNIMCIIRKEK